MSEDNALVQQIVDFGMRVILIDPLYQDGERITGVEVASTLEYIADALISLHTEPIVEQIAVYVRNHEALIGTPIQTLLNGLSMYSMKRGLVVVMDTALG